MQRASIRGFESLSALFCAGKMAEIIKKAYRNMFEGVLSGKKKFDLRLADIDAKEGDILVLKEIDEKRNFTGREIRKKIGFLLRTKDLRYWTKEDVEKYGYVVLGLED